MFLKINPAGRKDIFQVEDEIWEEENNQLVFGFLVYQAISIAQEIQYSNSLWISGLEIVFISSVRTCSYFLQVYAAIQEVSLR